MRKNQFGQTAEIVKKNGQFWLYFFNSLDANGKYQLLARMMIQATDEDAAWKEALQILRTPSAWRIE